MLYPTAARYHKIPLPNNVRHFVLPRQNQFCPMSPYIFNFVYISTYMYYQTFVSKSYYIPISSLLVRIQLFLLKKNSVPPTSSFGTIRQVVSGSSSPTYSEQSFSILNVIPLKPSG
jgi:hypothetical protein